ncbi:MAG: hypothetical protein AAB769_01375 [Patescibacteria group bacterium]
MMEDNKKEIKGKRPTTELTAVKFTRWVGSFISLAVHTALFIAFFVLGFLGFNWSDLLLILTTAVSLEAIYLAIFIQMTVNRNTQSLAEVEEDIDEIQEDIDEIQEDVGEISEEGSANEEHIVLEKMHNTLQKLMNDIEELKKLNKK